MKMSKQGKKILGGLYEALSFSTGDVPAASITINGHRYMPEKDCESVNERRAILEVEKTALEWRLREAQDKIDGLESDLESAIDVAFRSGAVDWCRLNYPNQFERLSAQETQE